jgi:dienelactone hydrolase
MRSFGLGASAGAPVERISFLGTGVVGNLFLPAESRGLPGIVCMAGAMGGTPNTVAIALANEGFPALALATHNAEHRPPRLSRLPVEYVLEAIEAVREKARPANGRVVLRGWSRGGELALLAASLSASPAAVIAYAPRCYVGREQDKPNNFADPAAEPAFTWQGRAVEGVPLPDGMRADPGHPTLEDLHGIPVERIGCPVMLVSGKSDTGIAGTTAEVGCASVMRRLELFKSSILRIHESYENAGHDIAGPPPYAGPATGGGTPEGNAAAVAASWPRGLAFMRALAETQPRWR